ncbi:MAG TPA: SMC family ATPase, partial [Anaerolineaceae bacterium]|nr:SMC family ATPase [Anaerolineaceae bacterium]
MIPVALKISGFLSYDQPVELDFSGFDLACISGANGAGKSSLLDAITWALFGQARRRDDAIINSHSKAAEVRLDFLYEGLLYRIQRTKPRDKSTLLEFYVRENELDANWRPLTEHTVRDTETRIQTVLRLDYETFTNASFFLQGKADQFAQQRPADRKRILSSILGLDAWETYRQAAVERRRAVEAETAIFTSQLNEIEEELKQEPERRSRLTQLQASLEEAARQRQAQEKNLENVRRISAALEEQRRLLELLRGGLENARQRAEASSVRLEERCAEKEEAQQQIADAVLVETAYQAWQKARQELQRWDEIAANFRQHENERSAPLMKIESERSRLEQELTTLQSQAKNVAELDAQVEPMEKRLAELEAEINALNIRLGERSALEDQLAGLQEQRAARNAENERLRQEMAQLKDRILRLNGVETQDETTLDAAAQAEQACPLCGQPLSPADRTRLVAELEMEGKEMGDRYRANQSWLALVDGQRAQIQTQLNDLREAETAMRQHQRQADALHDRLGQMRQALDEWQRGAALRLHELERLLAEGRYALTARAQLAKVDHLLKDLGYDAAQH